MGLWMENEGVQLEPRTDERRRALLRARWILWVAPGALAFVAIGGLVVIVIDPSRWWVWLIAYVLLGYLEFRNARRLRWGNRALRPEVSSETRT